MVPNHGGVEWMESLPADFTQSDGSWSVAVRLFDAAGGRSALPGRLGSQLLPRGLASRRLTGRLLRAIFYQIFRQR